MDNILALFETIIKLKELKRAGWLRKNIKNPESVADHSYSVALLTFYYAQKLNLNIEKCLMLSLIHDLAETKIGDLTPFDKNLKDKPALESQAIKNIESETGFKISGLWKELEEKKTKESKLVHDMDKIDMIMQAFHYEKKNSVDLEEFFIYTEGKLFFEESKKIYNKLLNIR